MTEPNVFRSLQSLAGFTIVAGPKARADQNGSVSEVHRQYPGERVQDGHRTVRFKWLQHL